MITSQIYQKIQIMEKCIPLLSYLIYEVTQINICKITDYQIIFKSEMISSYQTTLITLINSY